MNEWASRQKNIVDGHVHMWSLDEEASLLAVRAAAGIDKMALVCIEDAEAGTGLPQALYMKSRHPEDFFVFAGLNHAGRLSGGRVKGSPLALQVSRFVEMGCDGIKMLEGKPDSRRRLNIPVTDAYFADYWARVEEVGLPIVWHVADPEEFWDPARIPGWAKSRNWGYGLNDAGKEQLHAEVDQVLARHPRLKVSFAHFYFLSADLPRAGRLLDAHPGVNLDLAPGVEMLYNISRNPDAGREFFIRYADRIVLGTDLFSSLTPEQARYRAGIVFRWLETGDTFRVPAGADFLLGPPEDGVIRGMDLPLGVLAKIYRGNFGRLAGAAPRALNVARAIEVCEQLAADAATLSGKRAAETEAGRVAKALSAPRG